ncbi:hypothetical protein C8J57DRAFT_945511, partial [Mycena rebaudengoi]
MRYKHYNVDIRAVLKVEIAGWPDHIAFTSLGNISTMGELREICEKLRSGAIHWMNMTKSQLAELNVELAALRAKNGGSLKVRKERSDKGKTRGKG